MIHVFILNPEVGKPGYGKILRKELRSIHGLTYYVFDTRFPGEEKTLIRRIINLFEDDELRIYCCGGSGTFRNVVDALDDLREIEVAFIPIGMTNDFIKSFGSDAYKFSEIYSMINGEAIYLDYIKSNYGCSVNGVSMGVDGNMIQMINKERDNKALVGKTPYVVTFLRSLIRLKSRNFHLEIDGVGLNSDISEIIMGNGCFLAGFLRFSNTPEIASGKANYFVISEKRKIRLVSIIQKFVKGDVEYLKNHLLNGKCSEMVIRATDNKSFFVSFDGELIEVNDQLELTVKQKALKFIIPKGVSLP